MVEFLYNLVYFILFGFYKIFLMFHPEIKRFHQSREEGKRRIQEFLNLNKGEKKIWLHASSAGELEQALALNQFIKKKHPDIVILITVYSLSIKSLDKIPSEGSAYLPLDLWWQWNLKNLDFLAFITFTWDVFPNLLKNLRKKGCKTFLCSGAISKNSYKIKIPFLFRFLYNNFDGIGLVDEENYKNFTKVLHSKSIQITGDSRYDYIQYKLKHIAIENSVQKKLKLLKEILILGSTYRTCEKEILPYLNLFIKKFPEVKILIFPHKVEANRFKELQQKLHQHHLKFLLFSDKNFFEDYKKFPIIIVDQLGFLAYAYFYSKICYVGGGFHHRVHNTAEPAFCGSIPFTGPRIDSSPIAVQLSSKELLFSCSSGKEIVEKIIDLYGNTQLLNSKREEIKKYIKAQTGATKKFYQVFLKEVL
ncbi:MAG: 3-deoxy-D-manno-octulosonic acid transferase [Leptonema sp. (in: bacteria)]